MLAPERRTRGDLIAAIAIVAVVGLATTFVWLRSDARGTTSVTADIPAQTPATALAVPESLTEIWRTASPGTAGPLVVGGAAVTGDGGTVTGRDLRSGQELWRYQRDMPLCGVTAAWHTAVAVYRDRRGCGQVTQLDGASGARAAQRSSDADAAVTLSTDDTYVLSRGDSRMELWRSDLVRTLEYGRVDAPVNPQSQPRTGCELLSASSSSARVAVLERCPGEVTDRLTVLTPAPDDNQKPEQFGSSVLADLDPGTTGARVIAVSGSRTALYLPGGATAKPRIGIFDDVGKSVAQYPLPGPVSAETGAVQNGSVFTWWTGTDTIALGINDLAPRWTVPASLGPGTIMAGALLLPVPDAIAVVDLTTGIESRRIPVARGEPTVGPIGTTAAGGVVLEQRGHELVALS